MFQKQPVGGANLEEYFMSQKESDRAIALSKVKDKQSTLRQAAQNMNLSYSQAKRIWARYKRKGPKGLISQKRGRKSNRAVPQKKREEIAQIIEENYKGCKPFFISEKLAQYHATQIFIRIYPPTHDRVSVVVSQEKKNQHPSSARKKRINR